MAFALTLLALAFVMDSVTARRVVLIVASVCAVLAGLISAGAFIPSE
jgi:hypothetical protein